MTSVTGATRSSGFRLKEWIFTTDHKRVGVLYLIGAFTAFFAAGMMAMLMRTELASLGPTLTDNPNKYHVWLYFHGTAMIFGFMIPALTGFFANYCVPLMIGAKDVAFPRVNAFSVWLYWMGLLLALSTFVIPDPPDIMWTAYPPYSVLTSGNTAFYTFAVLMFGFSSIIGGVNLITTIIHMRAPGVTWPRLNIFIWATIGAFALQMLFVPIITVAVSMLSMDKYLGTNFLNTATGGSVQIFENFFWFYSHPAVYVTMLPGVGLVVEIVATFARNNVFNKKAVVYGGIGGTVLLSGVVWAHHLFVSGMPDWLVMFIVFTTLLISIPVGLIVISILGTLFRGAIEYKTPMLYASGFVFLFLIGGLSGIPNAMSAIYMQIHGTYWITGHFHYIMALSMTSAIIGGTYYIFPKMTGKMYNETLGKIGFMLFFSGVNITFFIFFIMGVKGMPRRYYDYQQFPQMEPLQRISASGAYLILLGALVILASWIHGLVAGRKAPADPWGSKSLEWTHTESPPPAGNFTEIPRLDKDWDPYGYKE